MRQRLIRIKKQLQAKILPIAEPITNVYPHHANLNAILLGSDYDLPMIFNDYIGIVYDADIERADFVIGYDIEAYIINYPLCINHGISREIVENFSDGIIGFIEKCIDDDYYIHCLVDTYYIGAYKDTYRISHFMHNILLYGYDAKKKMFYGADCFSEGKYSLAEVCYEEFERGFFIEEFDWLEGIRLIKKREAPYIGIWYQVSHLKEQIKMYTDGVYVPSPIKVERPIAPDDLRYTFGVRVYDEVVSYIHLVHETKRNVDVRILYVLFDHARLMAYMSKQLFVRGQLEHADEIYREFSRLADMLYKLNMSIIKLNLTSTSALEESVCKKLMEAKELDLHTMTMFGRSIQEKGICKLGFTSVWSADSIAIKKIGIWKYRNGKEGILYSRHQGDKLSCLFYGTDCSFEGYRHRKGGKYSISMDGKIMVEGDTFAEKEEVTELYKCSGLALGYHFAEISNLSDIGNFLIVSGFASFVNSREDISVLQQDTKVNDVEFIGFDRNTAGRWDIKYGKAGYDVIGYEKRLPNFMTDMGYIVRNAAYVILVRTNGGHRALRYGEKNENHIAAYYLQKDEFIMDITMAGEHETEFYCADYDRLGRSFEVIIEDGDAEVILDRQVVEEYQEGVYLKYKIKGHIKAKFRCLTGPDVTVSGVFWE